MKASKMHKEEERLPLIVFMNVTNSLTHLVLGAVAMLAFAFAMGLPSKGPLTQHVLLCVTGYIIVMTQAVLAFSPHTGWSRYLRQQDRRIVHWVMQIIGSILATTGSIIIIVDVNNNFYTIHGIFGFVAMILNFISLIGGIANLFLTSKKVVNLAHSIAGSLTILFVFLCLCLGFDTNAFRFFMGDTVTGIAIALTVLGFVGTILSATLSNVNKIKNR